MFPWLISVTLCWSRLKTRTTEEQKPRLSCTCVSFWVCDTSYSLFCFFGSSVICLIPHHPHSSLRTICTYYYSSYCFCDTSALWNPPMKGAAGWKISPLKDTISKMEILVDFSSSRGEAEGSGWGKWWLTKKKVRANWMKFCEKSCTSSQWSSVFYLLLLPASPSGCALNAGEYSRATWKEIRLTCLP